MMKHASFLAAALALLAGCGDDTDPTFMPPPGTTTTGGNGGQGGGGDGGGAAGEGGNAGAGGHGGSEPGVIADTPCEAPGASAVQLYAAAEAPALDELKRVGGRLMASGPDGRVLFDEDGGGVEATPTELGPDFNLVATEGSLGGMVASGDGGIDYLRFDEAGAAVAGPLRIASGTADGLALAWGAGVGTVVYGRNTTIRARAVGEDGEPLTPNSFFVAQHAYATTLALRAAARDVYAGIAFTGDGAAGGNTTLFALADAMGVLADPAPIFTSIDPHRVSDVVGTDDGWVLLIDGATRPVILALDENGVPSGDPMAIEGADAAYGLASLGNEVAVLVGRESGEAEVRAFDTALEPLAPWVCLGQDHDPLHPAAIARYDAGYAVVVTTAAGQVMLYRVDHLGTGSP